MATREELLKQLAELDREKDTELLRERELKNYETFKNRVDDWVIGKAHSNISKAKKVIGDTISVHGNCGSSYNALAEVTNSTHMFFHNMWSWQEQREFQDKLNQVAFEEIERIMSTLVNKLQLMGLQDTNYRNMEFPADKIEEIKQDMWDETCKVLDSFEDEDFLNLIKENQGWEDVESGEEIPPYKDVSLSHSKHILFRYIKEKREHLLKQFKECRSWERLMGE